MNAAAPIQFNIGDSKVVRFLLKKRRHSLNRAFVVCEQRAPCPICEFLDVLGVKAAITEMEDRRD